MLGRTICREVLKRANLDVCRTSYQGRIQGLNHRLSSRGLVRYSVAGVCSCSSANQSFTGQHVTGTSAGDDQIVEHEVRGKKLQGALWILLQLHAADNDPDTVFALFQKAEIEGLEVSKRMMNTIMRVFIKNSNIVATLQLHTWLKTRHSLHTVSPAAILGLCTLLVETKRGSEALSILKEYLQLDVGEKIELEKLRTDCKTLLNSAASTCDHTLTQQIFDELLHAEMIEPENYTVVPLLQCRMNSGDIVGAVEVAAQLYQDYKLLPKRMEILITLLKDCSNRKLNISIPDCINWSGGSDDPLGQMTSLVVSCYGHQQASHDLFFACIEADLPSVAQKVLKSHVEKVNVALMKKMIVLYGKARREKALLHLMTVFPHGDNAALRHRIYSALLDVYVAGGDESGGRKALDLYWAMKEEALTPSPQFLTSLTALLTALNIKLPPALS